ncbi:hypothetical protein K0M31_007506 [Melipona bicolor]|uniref:Uncharacterized protein n=1 Tax=Melipona bicolor TaxID=60889 RepID=A0AA40GBU6_9HYME|nr:hypothetical protein K0M31_007506 [Melipona bicolor]
MMWPGGIFEYEGVTPTFAQNFNESIPWEERIDTLISWFIHPIHPINFGILYIEEPDYHGHMIGIKGPEFDDILGKLDNILMNADSEFAAFNGYDNEAIEMHPFFFANGPAFMPKCKLEPFNILDYFRCFCKILDLHCPVGNGTISHLTKCP